MRTHDVKSIGDREQQSQRRYDGSLLLSAGFMITGLIFIASIVPSACVEVAEVKLDAFIGTATPGTEEPLPELAPITESRLLTFQTESGTRGLSISDQRLSTFCEVGTAMLSADGERMLCLPESSVTPLKFIDRFSGSLIMSLDEWTSTPDAHPTLPKAGSAFASPITVPDELDHIAVYNDFAQEVARIKALTLHGFVGPDHLVINSPAEIWSFLAEPEGGLTIEEVEPEPALTAIGTRDFYLHDAPPYGVIYDEQSSIYFLGVDQESARKVGDGSVIGLGERKVIALNREQGSPTKLNVYELGGESDSPPLNSIELPSGRFGQNFRAKMLGHEKVLFEAFRTRNCDERVEYPVETLLIDLSSNKVIVINDSQEPHKVSIGAEGRFGLIAYLDNCGRSMGSGHIYDLRERETRQLPEMMRGQVKDVAVSRKGAYLSVMSSDSVWLLDGQTLEPKVVTSSERMVGELRFIP